MSSTVFHLPPPDLLRPLSAAQRGIWFAHRARPDNPAYHIATCVEFSGPIDARTLRRAIRHATAEAEGLRVRFIEDGNRIRQVLEPSDAWEIPAHDFGAAADPRAAAQEWMHARLREPFDTSRAPLFEFALLAVSPTETLWFSKFHHLLVDGFGITLFTRRVADMYTALLADRAPSESPFGSFGDYLAEDTAYPDSPEFAAAAQHWAELLADRPAPTYLSGGAELARDVVRRTGILSTADTDRLAAATGRVGARWQIAPIAALAAYLGRMRGDTDVMLSLAVSGRTSRLARRVPTMASNVLPLRLTVRPEQTWLELIDHVATRVREVTAVQQYRGEDVRRDFVAAHPGQYFGPIVNIIPDSDYLFAGHPAALINLSTMPVDDLSLVCYRLLDGGLRIDTDAHADLYTDSETEAHNRRLCRLLTVIGHNPDQPIGAADLLDTAERRSLLVGRNATAHPAPVGIPALLFEAQAARTPDAVAVEFGDATLSFTDLDARADKLAGRLARHGVGRGTPVALLLDRSPDLIVAILAIAKAGGIYVPLDTRYPLTRMRAVLADMGSPLLLVDEVTHDHKGAGAIRTLRVDIDDAPRSAERPPLPTGPEDLAYVMFTSGSTGTPKGVQVTNRNVVEFAFDRAWADGRHHRVLMHSPHAFDASTYELWVPLLHGGTVVIATGEVDAALLRRYSHRVDAVFLTTALFGALAEDDPGCLAAVGEVWTGGEAGSGRLIRRVLDACPDTTVVSVYGPTETTTFATSVPLPRDFGPQQAVPIGRPMSNRRVYVLDEKLEPIPEGAVGQLYLAGAGVSRGYQARPGHTATRFVPDPFGPAGQRMYATGDLVRWRADLEFVGRIDTQVKLRGFRIELGEIEAVLTRHPEVSQAVTVVHDNPSAGKQLAAYVVPAENGPAVADPDQQLAEWREIYASLYRSAGEVPFAENFVGWNSSYDGRPIPLPDMREWRDATVAAIARLRPRRVLEIGVGSGLLLAGLAPDCETYWATDFSAEAIDGLQTQLDTLPELADRVHLLCRPAHSANGLPAGFFDTVILNSVVQYFPNADYLVDVLRAVTGLLAPGGAVFVGDVRNARLHRCFRTAIELRRSTAGASASALLHAARRGVLLDTELLVDPDFFTTIAARLPGIDAVAVEVKRGRAHNELTRYRYQAVLFKGPRRRGDEREPLTLRWGTDVADPARLSTHLAEASERPIGEITVRLLKVPNRRVWWETAATRALEQGDDVATALAIGDGGIDPEEIYELGERLGFRVRAQWSADAEHCLDYTFGAGDHMADPVTERGATDAPPATYTNNPASSHRLGALARSLGPYLADLLPNYMIPSAIVIVDRLPLNANGKIDRAALPAPRTVSGDSGREPGTPMERFVADLFADLLGLPVIRADDNFFTLGGHSLLATRLVNRLRSELGTEVTISELFESPTVAGFAARVATAREARPPLVARPRPEVVPLSYAQQRLWFLYRLEGPSRTYNIPLTLRIRGPLDPSALRAAISDIVARHETLRTLVPDAAGVPYQRILDPGAVEPEVADIALDERALPAALAAATGYGFELASEPPLRATLFALGPDEHVLLIVLHHIASDGWSLRPLGADLSAAYRARRNGRAWDPAPLPVQYADYARWEREVLGEPDDAGSVLNTQLKYWTETLAELPQELRLPTDHPRPATASYRGEAVQFGIDAELHGVLAEVAQRTGTTVYMVLQAGVAALLTGLGSGDDIPIGAPVAGRLDHALDDLIGCFVNTLVLRNDTSGDPSFTELLARVRTTALAAFQNQDLPFEYLVERLNPPRVSGRHPLFQVALSFFTAPDNLVDIPGLNIRLETAGAGASRFDLAFICYERRDGEQRPGGIDAFLEFSTDLFTRETATAITVAFVRLLRAAGAEPHRTIEELTAAVPAAAALAEAPAETAEVSDGTVSARSAAAVSRSVRVAFPSSLDLAGFATREAVGVETVVLAGVCAVLSWYCGRDDVAVTVDDSELRLNVVAAEGFRTLVDTVAEAVPAERSRSNVYRVGFEYREGSPPEAKGDRATGHDLSLQLTEEDGRLIFDETRVDERSARLFVAHLVRALEIVVADPDLAMGELEPLTERERRVRSGAEAESAAELSLVESIRQAATQRPDAIAVGDAITRWSYRELLQRAETLAGRLTARGIQPGEWVALVMSRGLAQVEAILGVLFAGAGYVPIDPGAPAQRMAFILSDCEARWTLTDDPATPGLAGYHGTVLHPAELDDEQTAELPPVKADSVAYCIYTSGTTGRPKGVIISHRNVTRLITGDRFPFDFGPDDVWTLFHSYAFDFSVWELFCCLTHGGRLVIVDDDTARDPALFHPILEREHVTVLNQTPSAFTQLLQTWKNQPDTLNHLRYVIFGGEPVRPGLIADWLRARPEVHTINGYGITEAGIFTTWKRLTTDDLDRGIGGIGRPFPADTVHVLDVRGHRRSVPSGAVGEIYIGGAGVASGYLERPDLDAQRFVDNPFGQGRLFRSGDLARYLPDGSLEYVGRADTQIKIRGYRIEPGEIESTIAEHPDVTEAAVLARDDRLVAFVVGTTAAPDPLRTFLTDRLPQYMIPAEFRRIDRIPLTANGKRDDTTLWKTGTSLPQGITAGIDSPVARQVAEVWARMLDREVVSGAASFFELGGHSLVATKVVAAIRDELGVDLPVRALFDTPRLLDFAALVEANTGPAEADPIRTTATETGDRSWPASSFQERVWLAEQVEPDTGLYNIPLAWHITGHLDTTTLTTALTHVIHRHEALRSTFTEHNGQLRQHIQPPYTPTITHHTLTETELTDWLHTEATHPFNLDTGPLLRTHLLNLPDHQILAITVHHLVWDMESARVFLHDLAEAYPLNHTPLRATQHMTRADAGADSAELSLVESIRQAATQRPDAIAVGDAITRWSYRELLQRAETLAGRLTARGIQPGEWVALVMSRGLAQVEAILGVLFAGAGYVPIDPGAPAQRMAFILSDCEARWTLTDDPATPGLAGYHGTVLHPAELDDEQTAELPPVKADSVAYCIYTSGTTGRPKGVIISHRNVTRLITGDRFPFDFGPDDVWTLFHSYAFDFSVWELFCCLTHGGRLVIVDDDTARDPALFHPILEREHVTVLNQTPSAFTQLLQTWKNQPDTLNHLRYVIFGGEKLQPRRLGGWMRTKPSVRMVNMYGITETTVHSTIRVLTVADTDTDVSVIGTPLPHTEIHLLDERRRPLPSGAVGEIYIGGAGVASGYLERPDLDAQRFVDNPFGQGRLFRSGDLARYLPDGSLEYVGRADTQIKIRGYRIEPGEIESTIAEHPDVTEAAVLARDDRLVAFVVGTTAAPDPLRTFLTDRLPQYMIPAEFRRIDRIPLTANGKRDDTTLWKTGRRWDTLQVDNLDSPTMVRLAAIWSRLLGVDVVSGDASFFELGGHSLLGGTLLAEVHTAFGVELRLRTLFDSPVLRDFAERIDRAVADHEPARNVSDEAGFHPVSGVQERIWLAEQVEPDTGLYNIPLAWHITGHLDTTTLTTALTHVIHRHEALRSTFTEHNGQLRQHIQPPYTPTITHHTLTETELTDWLHTEATHPFNLDTGPLLRTHLLNLPDHQILAITIHHLVFDGASLPTFLADLERAYRGAEPLPPGSQYLDFTAAQRRADEAGLDRWIRRLRGAPAYLPFTPPERPEPHGVVPLDLPADLPDRIERLRNERGLSWFMVMAAAWSAVLHRWTGRDDVTFGFPISNRDNEFDDVIGPCMNTVVMRSRCTPDSTVADLLTTTRDTVLAALEDQSVPFEAVIEALAPPRRLGCTPYADAALTLNVLPARPASLGDAELRPLILESLWETEIKFGLTLTVLENNGRLRATLSYRGDRFSRTDAERLAEDVVRLLDRIPADEDAPLREILPATGARIDNRATGAQYRDFVAARGRVDRAALARSVQRLRNAPSYLPFPVPATPGPHGVVPVPLPRHLPERITRIQAERGMSWFMVVAAALAGVLHRWTARDDVTLGFPVLNRDGEFTDVIGPCMNTVVVRSTCTADTTVGDLLDAVRGGILDALDDQAVPFEEVVRVLNPPRRPGSTPYVDVSLVMNTAPAALPRIGGLGLRPVTDPGIEFAGIGKFALGVAISATGREPSIALTYRGDRFDLDGATRLAGLLARLLDAVTGDRDARIATLDLLDEGERDLVRGFESGAPALPPATVPDLLAARIAERPDAIAIHSSRGELDYRTLDRKARILATRLRPDDDHGDGTPIVALAVGRGEHFVVGMLAAWYAGCGFCPLDPDHPGSRAEQILRDVGAHVLVTEHPRTPPDGVRVVALSEIDHATTMRGAVAPPARVSPDTVAYVLYTSGTTGTPKGVAVGHANLAQLVRGHIDTFGMSRNDRVSQVVNVSFDVAQAEIWSALCAGARLLPYERPILVPELSRWLDDNAITVLSAATPLAEALWTQEGVPDSVRWLIFGGAALAGWPPAALAGRLANGYGPTETTIFATFHLIDPAGSAPLDCVGRPTSGTRIHVLDEAGQRCPVGVAGEIYISGSGVAQGYWRRPELTSERFLDHGPDDDSGPVYRTGDLGRWLPDGTLEYLGRRDRQIKIRGFRVEPGEVESALRDDPLVATAVVIGRPAEVPALVAYVVPEADRDTAAVLARLKIRLPSYLVPDAVVWLDRIPLSVNGKIDVAALPRPHRADLVGSLPYAAPDSDLETRIARVWSSVLGVDTVGVHDNFFDLGGHSLLLSTLHTRLCAELATDLPIRRLFEFPTVRLLAQWLADDPDRPGIDIADVAERAQHARRARAARPRPRTR
ncbi:non-ribosomal peptide synthetase [Nocardia sp. BMG51109]|uniref:non-ribosomal peptide synthetase n=1 Tax=Nocardia sp. BMG51109 TaxID=1056816 RepID=UPI0004631F9D|nr:non-ribosomal peptide synthetase [Nocardia sp. BMG51109]